MSVPSRLGGVRLAPVKLRPQRLRARLPVSQLDRNTFLFPLLGKLKEETIMSHKPENEPFIAPSADDKSKNVKKGRAGRGLIAVIAAYAAAAFLIYLVIILIASYRSMT